MNDSKLLMKVGVLVLIGLGCFLMGAYLGPAWALPGQPIPYNQFENDVKSKAYTHASVDGNILLLQTSDNQRVRTEAPVVDRAVGLLIKFEVPVSAYRPLPGSGLTWPVIFALLIPYGILAFYAFALAQACAAAGGPGLAESSAEESPLTDPDEDTAQE